MKYQLEDYTKKVNDEKDELIALLEDFYIKQQRFLEAATNGIEDKDLFLKLREEYELTAKELEDRGAFESPNEDFLLTRLTQVQERGNIKSKWNGKFYTNQHGTTSIYLNGQKIDLQSNDVKLIMNGKYDSILY
jgi:hypothetical protein